MIKSDPMSHPIFADFHNADATGRLRLNCIGTIEDLARHNIELQDGQLLTIYSEDLEADGVVQYSEEEKVWVARIDWNQIRQVEVCISSSVVTPTTSPAFATILTQAAANFRGETGDRPAAKAVVTALLQAEKAAKQQRLAYPLESLLGRWQLCFTAPKTHQRGDTVSGRGWYIPKIARAHISFNTTTPTPEGILDRGEIGNQLQFGSLLLQLTGPLQYSGKKNLLAFDFTQMQFSLFGRTIYRGGLRGGTRAEDFYGQSVAKLPFFAFFLVTEEFIAARGRGGGIALWVKDT